MTIHKCDRCGEIIENFESENNSRHFFVNLKDDPQNKIHGGEIELCNNCYDQLIGWIHGDHFEEWDSYKGVDDPELRGFMRGYLKAAEEYGNKEKHGKENNAD